MPRQGIASFSHVIPAKAGIQLFLRLAGGFHQFFKVELASKDMASKPTLKENPARATPHCLRGVPYEMTTFARMNRQTPLYTVKGSDLGMLGAKKALKEAFQRHGGTCFYCKQRIAKKKLTLDHVEPEMLKRNGHLQNLVLAHKTCNAEKGHRPIEAYHPEAGREWLSALLKQVQDRLNRL